MGLGAKEFMLCLPGLESAQSGKEHLFLTPLSSFWVVVFSYFTEGSFVCSESDCVSLSSPPLPGNGSSSTVLASPAT